MSCFVLKKFCESKQIAFHLGPVESPSGDGSPFAATDLKFQKEFLDDSWLIIGAIKIFQDYSFCPDDNSHHG